MRDTDVDIRQAWMRQQQAQVYLSGRTRQPIPSSTLNAKFWLVLPVNTCMPPHHTPLSQEFALGMLNTPNLLPPDTREIVLLQPRLDRGLVVVSHTRCIGGGGLCGSFSHRFDTLSVILHMRAVDCRSDTADNSSAETTYKVVGVISLCAS